jgi:hypothetical protein
MYHLIRETGFQVIFGQRNERIFMARHEFNNLLIIGDRIPPILFLLFQLGYEEVGVGILGIDLQHITKGDTGLREVPRLDIVLRFCTVLRLPLLGPSTGRQDEYQRQGEHDGERPER